jgi:hypothetical protein
MKRCCVLFFLLLSSVAFAQHCPWDCSGLLMIRTNVTPAELKKMDPVLVDANKKLITDSVYGTGKETHDSARILFYDDFLAYRTERIKLHHWYGFDTVYHFAKGHHVARFNFCRFNNKKLFIRFHDPSTAAGEYSYIEMPNDRRIHLHEYNMLINRRKSEELLSLLQPLILQVSRSEWKLPDR